MISITRPIGSVQHDVRSQEDAVVHFLRWTSDPNGDVIWDLEEPIEGWLTEIRASCYTEGSSGTYEVSLLDYGSMADVLDSLLSSTGGNTLPINGRERVDLFRQGAPSIGSRHLNGRYRLIINATADSSAAVLQISGRLELVVKRRLTGGDR